MNVSLLISLVLQRARRIREDQTTKCQNGEVLISQAGGQAGGCWMEVMG
jgi:hypothetical protein